jgi:hypothetical protein
MIDDDDASKEIGFLGAVYGHHFENVIASENEAFDLLCF